MHANTIASQHVLLALNKYTRDELYEINIIHLDFPALLIVTFDGVLIITKGYIYKKYITMKHLYGLTTFFLLTNLS